MKGAVLVIFLCSLVSFAQPKEFVGKAQPGAVLERFTLKGGRSIEGIWDSANSQVHIVSKTNHIGNLPVTADEIVTRKPLGDGSQVKIYSDVDMAEKVLLLHQQNFKAAQARVGTATRNRDNLHATYKGKNLPTATYNTVMAQYKAADDEVASAEKAVEAARSAFSNAQEVYRKAGGKTDYQLP
jgi:hypothetical protein